MLGSNEIGKGCVICYCSNLPNFLGFIFEKTFSDKTTKLGKILNCHNHPFVRKGGTISNTIEFVKYRIFAYVLINNEFIRGFLGFFMDISVLLVSILLVVFVSLSFGGALRVPSSMASSSLGRWTLGRDPHLNHVEGDGGMLPAC